MARACVPWRAVSVGVGPVPILVRSTVSAGPWLSPCVGRLSVGGLARASDVADAQGFALFYPRPLRPVRASAPLRKATTARQPTAHTGDRPRPPLPTGPPSSLSHLISQRDARASTKQSTPAPRPRNRSLSGANTNPGRRRSVGTPWVSARARTPPLASSLPTSTLTHRHVSR